MRVKKTLIFSAIFALFLIAGCVQFKENFCQNSSGSDDICGEKTEVYFCPEDDCANRLIEKINSSNETINIAIYSFTLDSVAASLIAAKQRGVQVKVLFDDSQITEKSEDKTLLNAGIPIKRKKSSAYMHNKFCIIDGELVGTGSFNYSKNGQTENDENLIFILSKKIAKQYQDEFDELWQETD
jgi:phosphatidylserine/phosphatidylglycerophosphate/cardiolipin synthase-like enzyme